jgi:hypothetical protein
MVEKRSKFDAVLDWRKMIFIFPLAALWAIPISRAVNFLEYTRSVLNEEQTLNALNDVHYGMALLVLYVICLVFDVIICLLFARKNLGVLLLLLSVPIWIVIEIIRYKPEDVVVLIPSLNLMKTLLLNGIPLLVGLAIFAIKKFRINSLGNAGTN